MNLIKNNIFKIKVFLILLFLVQNSAFCAPEPKLKIGFILGLTGPAAVWGNSARQAALLAEDPHTEFVIEDSKSDPKSAVSAWKKLVEVDKVDAVVGDVWAFLTNPLIPLSQNDKIILISPTVLEAAVDAKSEYFYTLGGQVTSCRKAIDRFFDLHKNKKTVSIFYWDDTWGRAYLKEWTESANQHSVKVIDSISVNDWENDYRTEVLKISRNKPDILIAPHHMERILKRLKEFKMSPAVLTTGNIQEPFLNGEIAKDLAANVYFSDWRAEESFENKYMQKWGQRPIAEAHSTYDAVVAIRRAWQSNPDDMPAELAKLKFIGTAGKIDFSKGTAVNDSEARLQMFNKDGSVSLID